MSLFRIIGIILYYYPPSSSSSSSTDTARPPRQGGIQNPVIPYYHGTLMFREELDTEATNGFLGNTEPQVSCGKRASTL